MSNTIALITLKNGKEFEVSDETLVDSLSFSSGEELINFFQANGNRFIRLGYSDKSEIYLINLSEVSQIKASHYFFE